MYFASGRFPAPADFGNKFSSVFFHQLDKRLIACIFVRRSPEDHLGENRCQVNSLPRQAVGPLAAVGGVGRGANNSIGDEFAEAVGEYIGRDAFVAFHKLLIRLEAAEHHVADDEKGPAVAQHFDGGVQWTLRPAPGRATLGHGFTVAYFHLQIASNIR